MELCLIISRAARYLPKAALNNIPSLCVYYDLYGRRAITYLDVVRCQLVMGIEHLVHVEVGMGDAVAGEEGAIAQKFGESVKFRVQPVDVVSLHVFLHTKFTLSMSKYVEKSTRGCSTANQYIGVDTGTNLVVRQISRTRDAPLGKVQQISI